MTRKIIITLLSLVCAVVCSVGLIACSGHKEDASDSNQSIPAARILPPYVLSFGSYLYWQPISNAAEYEIYENETFVKTVTDTKYELGEVQNDSTYYIIAKNGNVKSKKSNIAYVSKNCNFADDEIYYYTSTHYTDTISANVRKVVINGYFSADIVLQERTSDITFELNNAWFEGLSAENNICSRFNADYNVILDINGECTINGKSGMDGRSFDDSKYDDKCIDGYDGTAGGNGICVPTLIIQGNGKLTVKGGKGGKGGNGSGANGAFNSNKPGKGSFGGNGGTALLTEYLLTNPQSNVVLDLTDGAGGMQGFIGKHDGNVIGASQALADASYWIFTDGKNGASSLGTVFNTSGKIYLNGEEI